MIDTPQSNDPIVGYRVELQLFTTLKCNLACRYCTESIGDVRNSQGPVTYTLDQLDNFINSYFSDREIVVTFYGGEPLLNIDYISQVIERYPLFRFQLQTNGTLLQRLPPDITARFSNVLVSLDGGEQTTDSWRGKGTYRRVMENLEKFRKYLNGTLTARMTWANPETTFEEIDWLTEFFDFIYFQFVHLGGAYSPQAVKNIQGVLKRLVDRFFAQYEVYPIIPLMGCVRNKLFPSRAQELYSGLTQCRVSSHLLNILPDGSIFACPDMAHIPEMQHGDLKENWLKPSPLQYSQEMPCRDCAAYSYCRGNCMKGLYLSYVKGDEVYRCEVMEPICRLVTYLGSLIDQQDYAGWYARLPITQQNLLRDCSVYEYVEIMP